jgi:hypothetical protein
LIRSFLWKANNIGGLTPLREAYVKAAGIKKLAIASSNVIYSFEVA